MATRGETKDKAADENIQCIMDQVTQMLGFSGPQAEELARRSSENLQAVTRASTVLARGVPGVFPGCSGVLERGVRPRSEPAYEEC